MRIQRTKTGARLLHGGHVVSELPGAPGPTHSVFDVLAALALARPQGRLAMLGFAAGGTVAPLRALGFSGPIEAVDLSVTAVPAFRTIARDWSGDVSVDRADAAEWLSARPGRFDVVLEDLSMQIPGDVTKPPVSYERLPSLLARALRPGGIAIVNVLPVAGMPWNALLGTIAAPFRARRLVLLDQFDNRILLLGRSLPPARDVAFRVSRALRELGSSQAGSTRVRTLPR